MSKTDWAPGKVVASTLHPPITLETLKRYAAASGDFNPIHLDREAARAAGHPDIIAHGMLVMGYLGVCLGKAAGERPILSFDVRFRAVTVIGSHISCKAVVDPPYDEHPDVGTRVAMTAEDQYGEIKLVGAAILDLIAPQKS